MGKANFNFDLFLQDCKETSLVIDENTLAGIYVNLPKYSYPETEENWIASTRNNLKYLNMTVDDFLKENKLNSLVHTFRSFMQISQPKTFDNNNSIPYRIIDFIRANFEEMKSKRVIEILKIFEEKSEG